uniref:hypothetical protein n=1 Tax=Pseudactinotalea sp. TaxID=1926260 RepID=UPI003B3AB89D
MRRERRTAATDRATLIVLGLVLVAAGGATAAWQLGAFGAAPEFTEEHDRLIGQPWWPAVAIVAGVVLVLVGVWWLLRHRPGGSVTRLALPGSSFTTRLRVRPDAAVSAANEALLRVPDVRSSRLRLVLRRGAIEVHGSVVAARDAD